MSIQVEREKEYENQWSNGNFGNSENEVSSRWIHKTGGRRNPNLKWDCIFCESTRILGSNYLGFGTVEIRNFTQLRQKILR